MSMRSAHPVDAYAAGRIARVHEHAARQRKLSGAPRRQRRQLRKMLRRLAAMSSPVDRREVVNVR